MRLRNRVVMLPHGLVYAERSSVGPTDRHIAYYSARARGGVGLVCIESAYVSASGDHRIPLVYANDPACVPAYERLVDAVHREGAAVCGQLTHYGNGADQRVSRRPLLGPSELPAIWKREATKPLTIREMATIREDFARSASHFAQAGFDGVELKAGHDGLLRQFLSPLTNDRADEYGGSLENRLRYLLEVCNDVREAIGTDVALGIRMTLDECFPGGFGIEEASEFVRLLADSNLIDYISSSIAIVESVDLALTAMHVPEGYAAPLCNQAAEASPLPVIAAGRIHRPEHAEQLLAEGKVAAIGMARQLIADPDWASKAFAGSADRIRPCTACNQLCLGNLDYKIPISCTVNPYAGHGELRTPVAPVGGQVVVVGGGPAGMEAARVAAEDGHAVTLFEQSERLGGQLALASSVPRREGWAPYLDWLASELTYGGVDVRLGEAADAERIVALDPSLVVIATGSTPKSAPLDGAYDIDTYLSVDLQGSRVAVADCGTSGPAIWSAVLTAAARGADEITVVTPLHVVGEDLDSSHFIDLYRAFHREGVRFVRDHAPMRLADGQLTAANVFTGKETVLDVDVVVASAGREPVGSALRAELEGHTVVTVGDALVPRDVSAAVREGQEALEALRLAAVAVG
jgi:2,4-dienoyl-CoA reductase (NADPH2)